MSGIFKTAAGISNQWSLAAFAIAAILYFLLKRRGKIPAVAWASIAAILILGLTPIVASVYVQRAGIADLASAIYRVRVTVLDPQQMPIDSAKVWSSMGGEPKRVTGGWQFDIPAASKPADGRLTVYASVAEAFLGGRRELRLGDDRNPSITIQLARDASASVRGIVVDQAGHAIANARVSVAGYESEGTTTQVGGSFQLPAHAARGQQTQLHAEKEGYKAVNQWQPAGDDPSTLVLEREGKIRPQ